MAISLVLILSPTPFQMAKAEQIQKPQDQSQFLVMPVAYADEARLAGAPTSITIQMLHWGGNINGSTNFRYDQTSSGAYDLIAADGMTLADYIDSFNSPGDGSGTNYQVAFDESINYFQNTPITADNTIHYFISDGSPNSGGGVDDDAWESYTNLNVQSFSFGFFVNQSALNAMSNLDNTDENGLSVFLSETTNFQEGSDVLNGQSVIQDSAFVDSARNRLMGQ